MNRKSTKIDYQFKQKVLKEHSDIVKRQNKASYYDYCVRTYENDGLVLYGLKSGSNETLDDLYIECCLTGMKDVYDEARKLNEAYYKRLKRLRSKVSDILTSGEALFLTLTFTDDVLKNTTEKQRRVAVSRYLKTYQTKYVANIDFGAKNHREHYHALILTPKVERLGWCKYGAINFEKIRLRTDLRTDEVKLSKYINKLTYHAIKETTKRSAILYSR